MTETLENTARRIAEHGREALLARLRPAFQEAAAAHRDTLTLDDDQLEQMVQRAADRADGLQWRRALASVATEQLGIGLGEALSHPAVARAQAIVGAPSYEEALSALGSAPSAIARPPAAPDAESPVEEEPLAEQAEETAPEPQQVPDPELEAVSEPEAEPEPEPEPEAVSEPEPPEIQAPPVEHEQLPEPELPLESELAPSESDASPAATEPEPPAPVAAEAEPEPEDEPEPEVGGFDEDEDEDAIVDEPDGVRLRATHLGGIANLSPAEGDLELLISSDGLDIMRGPDSAVLGRLTWAEIDALETPEASGRFRRKRQPDAHLVVRSPQGSASFEIPGVTPAELRQHLEPLVKAHGR